jgi:ABC-type lipoprotein release transport system permease subunit
MNWKQIVLLVYVVLVAAVALLTRSVLLTLVFAIFLALLPLALAAVASSLWAIFVALAPVQKVPLRYNLRSLSVRWKTTVMTCLAFTCVVFLLILMLTFVNGMERTTQSSGQPGNVLVLSDGATDEVMSNLPAGAEVERLPQEVQRKVLRTEDGKRYLATKEVYVIVSQPLMNVSALGATRRLTQMRGVNDAELAARVHGVKLIKGRWFASTGVLEVVLGEGIAAEIAHDRQQASIEPGAEIELGPYKWKVVGLIRTTGTTFNSEVWTSDRNLATKTFGRENAYSSYVMRTASAADARYVADQIKNFRAEWSFDAWPENEYYAKFNMTNQLFTAAIIVIAAIMAVGGALGITNTMFAVISQRVKDIGVLRILGYTGGQVLTSFQMESLAIGLVGGLLGCALSVLVYLVLGLFNVLTVNSIISSSSGGGRSVVFELSLDAPTVLIGLLFSLFMGAVGGFLPAVSAMRLKPLESLR